MIKIHSNLKNQKRSFKNIKIIQNCRCESPNQSTVKQWIKSSKTFRRRRKKDLPCHVVVLRYLCHHHHRLLSLMPRSHNCMAIRHHRRKKKQKKHQKKKPKQRKRKLRVANVLRLQRILVLPMVPIK